VKERLTGAIILVALIVLLVPELLSGPVRDKAARAAAAVALGAPAAAGGGASRASRPPLRSYTLSLMPAAPNGAVALAQPARGTASADAQSAAYASLGGAAQPAPRTTATPEPVPPEHAPAPAGTRRLPGARSAVARSAARTHRAAAPAGRWVVQLGSFSSRPNADRLAAQLHRHGFRAYVSSVRVGRRLLWRVRSGTLADRSAASRLAARLRAHGYRGSELLPIR
jgi:cell division septation protein DedD